ncbi:hypothetical protein AVEN_156657-1 [Araneus ventricosus]|uniref:Uncharacterized protein n=1 Tax=Araneus ventricosus TaxID=182803 RepID=A0A4Y2WYY5_ARAVE|nr:hypothetical protein AVEN_156657-1 [Araneus ventricosus]
MAECASSEGPVMAVRTPLSVSVLLFPPGVPRVCGEKTPDRVPPYHPFNYRMSAAIFIRVMSRHGQVTMHHWMKPLTAPPGGKEWS